MYKDKKVLRYLAIGTSTRKSLISNDMIHGYIKSYKNNMILRFYYDLNYLNI